MRAADPWERIPRWILNATVLGLAISLFAHALMLLVAHFIEFRGPGGGNAPRAEAPPVQVAVVSETELATLQSRVIEVATPATPETIKPDTPEVEQLDAPLADALAPNAVDLGDLGQTLGAGEIGMDAGLGAGDGAGTATFFGAEAQGSRFCYIVDVSGSMLLDNKIETLKLELIRSISALFADADFVVLLYAGNAAPLGARDDWTEATDPGKAWASRQIAAIVPSGPTEPLGAFEIAWSLRPRPDAIYFMTDGEFDEEIANEIIRQNGRTRIPIHTITFINDEAAPYMRRIATRSGGTYNHVPGP